MGLNALRSNPDANPEPRFRTPFDACPSLRVGTLAFLFLAHGYKVQVLSLQRTATQKLRAALGSDFNDVLRGTEWNARSKFLGTMKVVGFAPDFSQVNWVCLFCGAGTFFGKVQSKLKGNLKRQHVGVTLA